MRVVMFESILATPHTETLIELSILHSIAGDEVIYVPAYRFLGSSPWNSPINGDPSLSSSIPAWDHYITDLIAPYVKVWIPEFVYQNIPPEWVNMSDLLGYIDRYTATLYNIDITSSDPKTTNARKAEIASLCERTIKLVHVIVEHFHPDQLYCFNGRTPSSWPLSHIAERIGLNCNYHERGASKEKYALFNKPPAYMSAWSSLYLQHRSKQELSRAKLNSAYFFRLQAAGKLNNFSYEKRDFDDSLPNFLAPNEQFVVYFCTSNREIDTVPDNDAFFPSLPTQSACINLLKVVCRLLNIKLVIRTHPSGMDDIAEVMSLHDGLSCFVIPPDSKVSSYILGSKAKARFSVGSTIGYELIYRGLDCALMARSIVLGEEGLSTTTDKDSIRDYILKSGAIEGNNDFIYYLGDFLLSYGYDYHLFNATGLFSGYIDLTQLNSKLKYVPDLAP